MLPQKGHNDRTDDVDGEGGVNSSLGCRLTLAPRPTVILMLCKAGTNRGEGKTANEIDVCDDIDRPSYETARRRMQFR
jgi:hypothetical protein